MRSFEASLERLGVDRIDILFVHDVDIFTHGSKEALGCPHRGVHVVRLLRAAFAARPRGDSAAFGGGINEWQVAQTLAERGDFDLFLLAGRYTLLEQEALQSVPAALPEARHRHRAGRPLQFRRACDRAEAWRLLQL
ncbi:hypothetical protein ACVOMV_13995 [Mesorhizobium atlanticum]